MHDFVASSQSMLRLLFPPEALIWAAREVLETNTERMAWPIVPDVLRTRFDIVCCDIGVAERGKHGEDNKH